MTLCLQRILQVFYLPFIGPLDYASHFRVYVVSSNAPLIFNSYLPIYVRISSTTDCYVFFEDANGTSWHDERGPLRLWRAVYGPDFGDYQMELFPTQPCAGLRALLLSEFASFFIYSLTYLIFPCGQRM